jgi:hypothetical protein
MTWHCQGLYDVTKGMGQWIAYCAATDPAGDQIVFNNASDGKFSAEAKSYTGSGTVTTGTGKYAGITGSWTGVFHGQEFKSAAEGTFTEYVELKGSYKLP